MICIAPALPSASGVAGKRKFARRTGGVTAAVDMILAGGYVYAPSKSRYGAAQARVRASLALLGRDVSVADFRCDGDVAVVDIDAAPGDPAVSHAGMDFGFGLGGSVARHGVGDRQPSLEWVTRD